MSFVSKARDDSGRREKDLRGTVLVCSSSYKKYHSLGGLKNGNFFSLTVLDTSKSKMKVQANSIPGRSPHHGFRWLSACWIFRWWRERGVFLTSLILKSLTPSEGFNPHEHLKLNYLPKAPHPTIMTRGLGLQCKNLEGKQTIIHNRDGDKDNMEH